MPCKLFRLISLSTLLLLNGCVEFTQEMWVNADGSGRVQYRIGLSEQIMKLTVEGSSDKSACRVFYRDAAQLREQPGIQSVRLEQQTRAGVYACIIDIHVDDFERLNALQGQILQDNETTRQQQEFEAGFELRKDGKGSGHFRQLIRNRIAERKAEPGSAFDAQAEQLAKTLLAQMVTGKYWTVTLHAPAIITTNGELSADKQSVTWQIPFYDLLINEAFTLQMQADFDYDPPWYKKVWKWVT